MGVEVLTNYSSIWIRQSQAVFFKPGHATAGENPELRTLFFKLSWLLSACILPTFVFDGPLRPSIKRGKNVIAAPHWLTDDFQRLINAFGFYSHQAPGEAEAELAQLNAVGLIDAIMTDDSDVSVFGATHVIRSSNTDNVTVHTLDKIKSDAQVLLTREDMVLIALLVGGDYDPAGLPGCGMTIAHKLVRSCSLGHELVHAFLTRRDIQSFSTFLEAWRNCLRTTLSTKHQPLLGRRFNTLATSIGEDFPQVPILQGYVEPITSWSTGNTPPDGSCWKPCAPDLAQLTRLCERMFAWGTSGGIQARFLKHVWPGACVRVLSADSAPLADITTSNVLGLRGPPYSQPQETTQPPPLPSRVMFRIPVNMVNHALPDLVKQFTKR
ncbi:PIN domain-like protein [Amanita muscaria]